MAYQSKPVSEQVMVITGASSGIGLATAIAAAGQGAKVVLAARSGPVLESAVEYITGAGGKARSVTADVSQRVDVERIAATAIETFGRIDSWVNDAAIGMFARLDEALDEDSRRLFDINFWGVVHGSMVALPHLAQTGGVLINVGSEASDVVVPLQAMYSASKHAVKGYTDGLRLEMEADGNPIRVVLIQPTVVDTPFPEHAANYLDSEPKLPTPMIEPEKVAAAILDAAVNPKDAVKVGLVAKLDTTMMKLLPSLTEEFMKMQVGRQQRDELSHPREGALYQPSEDGRIRGRGNENATSMREARKSNLRTA
jgi:short-subunit dehydrogenase